MKMPGKELAIVVVGLAVLAAVWVLVFVSAQRAWRPAHAESGPASGTTRPVQEEPGTEAVPGPVETGPAETGPEETHSSAEPDAEPEAEAPPPVENDTGDAEQARGGRAEEPGGGPGEGPGDRPTE